MGENNRAEYKKLSLGWSTNSGEGGVVGDRGIIKAEIHESRER